MPVPSTAFDVDRNRKSVCQLLPVVGGSAFGANQPGGLIGPVVLAVARCQPTSAAISVTYRLVSDSGVTRAHPSRPRCRVASQVSVPIEAGAGEECQFDFSDRSVRGASSVSVTPSGALEPTKPRLLALPDAADGPRMKPGHEVWRRRPDSNRGTGLCRPLPKPLGHAAVTVGRSA